MAKFTITIILALCSLAIQAKNFHAIIFANTECPGDPRDPNDIGIGPSVTSDFYRMKIEMTTIASFIDYRLKTYYFTGDAMRFSKKSLDRMLTELKCTPDDIVFFYYSGHGSRSKNEKTRFPQMNLVVDPYHSNLSETDANYPLYNVLERIKKKNPRLTIVVGDMCNSVADWVTPKSLPGDKTATKVEETPVKFYKELFLNVSGSIIATSSKPGQTSAGYPDGGAFTIGLMEALQAIASEGLKPSWSNLFENAIIATESITKNQQTPIYDASDLHTITHENTVATTTATMTESSGQTDTSLFPGNITTDEAALNRLLTTIGSEKLDEEQRITLAEKALPIIFSSPKSIVRVVGRDGKTEVSTKTAKAYLDWLTVTTNLYQVAQIRAQYDSDHKFIQLQVHEMYK